MGADGGRWVDGAWVVSVSESLERRSTDAELFQLEEPVGGLAPTVTVHDLATGELRPQETPTLDAALGVEPRRPRPPGRRPPRGLRGRGRRRGHRAPAVPPVGGGRRQGSGSAGVRRRRRVSQAKAHRATAVPSSTYSPYFTTTKRGSGKSVTRASL